MITRDSIFIKRNNKNVDLRTLIKYNCDKTIKYLAEGKYLTGIFQLNKQTSANMLKTIFAHLLLEKDIKDIVETDVINRLSDITTLIRPACIQAGADKRYYDRLCGKDVPTIIEKQSPFYQSFYEITHKTQLELLYQEQIMKIISFIFGVSDGKADNYRRAFEKGDSKKLDEYKKEFWGIWSQKLKESYDKKQIAYYCGQFWNYLLLVSGYLFNLSHAVAYSYQTYITAYIKVTTALMIAITINRHSTDKDKITQLLSEAFKLNIKINLPKINQVYNEATPILGENNEVYLSCESIKGIGKSVSNKISSKNNFKSIDEFLKFASEIKLNKAVMSLLVKIGFFSPFNNDKQEVWKIIDNYCDIVREEREMKLIKKYNRYIYKPKKGETIVKEDVVNAKAIVEVSEKKWDMGIYENKFTKDFWNEYFLQKELIGFPLISIASLYSNYEVEPLIENELEQYLRESGKKLSSDTVYRDIIIVNNIRYGEKGNFKWSILTDSQDNRYFISQKHVMLNENDILYIHYITSSKGNNLIDYQAIDRIY